MLQQGDCEADDKGGCQSMEAPISRIMVREGNGEPWVLVWNEERVFLSGEDGHYVCTSGGRFTMTPLGHGTLRRAGRSWRPLPVA